MKKLVTIGLFALTLGSSASAMASVQSETVEALDTDVYTRAFRRGHDAAVAVKGDGDTLLRLSVYDENGHFITSDTCRNATCAVSWKPRWTGEFQIKVANLGDVYNDYVIAME